MFRPSTYPISRRASTSSKLATLGPGQAVSAVQHVRAHRYPIVGTFAAGCPWAAGVSVKRASVRAAVRTNFGARMSAPQVGMIRQHSLGLETPEDITSEDPRFEPG